MLVCICVEFAKMCCCVTCAWVCVYVGGVVDVVECGFFFSLGVGGWIVSLCSGCVGCCVFIHHHYHTILFRWYLCRILTTPDIY